jgi:hypothetical protein
MAGRIVRTIGGLLKINAYAAVALAVVLADPGRTFVTVSVVINVICFYMLCDCVWQSARTRDLGWFQLAFMAFMAQVICISLLIDTLT